MIKFRFLWLILGLGLSACSTLEPIAPEITPPKVRLKKVEPVVSVHSKIYDRLVAHYHRWQGTPYKYGGHSHSGIDCSAFAQTIFADCFSCQIPRTTYEQVKKGRFISRSDLQTGDLVFFKTGSNSRHVGIYLQPNRFIHASSSHGVTMSRLDNPYWNPRYWQARRMPMPF